MLTRTLRIPFDDLRDTSLLLFVEAICNGILVINSCWIIMFQGMFRKRGRPPDPPTNWWILAAPPLSSLGGEVRKHSPVVNWKVGLSTCVAKSNQKVKEKFGILRKFSRRKRNLFPKP